MTAVHIFHARFRGLFKKKMADSRVKKSNCMARFEKAKTSVAIKGRKKVIPCTTLKCIKAAAIRPAHSFAWFDMVEASFPDELWYSNFRVTVEHLHTFTTRLVRRYLDRTLQCEKL